VFKKLVFALCFFHALIQERRKFGPLGWNIAYEYTSGDLTCCIQQTQMFLNKYEDVPYRVIRELSGHIHYGGRVTDDWDRRTLTTILETFINPDVLKDDYAFSPSGKYTSVKCDTQQEYLKSVGEWEINTHPEVFGLHENADITCARNETFDTLATIVVFEGTGSGGGKAAGKTPDEMVTELSKNILGRIRAPFDIAAFMEKFPTKYEDSMNTVVVQEGIRFSKLLKVLRGSLENLILAIQGMVVMSKELDEVYQALQTNTVPVTWANAAYPSLKPLASWVTDLAQRLSMIEKWYDYGHPRAYWISGFYFPQAFLTGILQNHARAQQISIDTISYSFEWITKTADEIKAAPPSGCYIHGMYIEGARVDGSTLALAESRPKVLFEQAPVVWLVPTIDRNPNVPNVYRCPLYKTLRRAGTLSTTGHSTNYVLTLEVPTQEPAEHWIKRGVAMVCSLNY
jgi:dynein heavy chain